VALEFVDNVIIDGFVNLAGKLMLLLSFFTRRIQSGYVQNYAAFIILGAMLFWLITY